MRSMAAIQALPADYIDAAYADSAIGPRIVLKVKLRTKAVKLPSLSIDLACAEQLAGAILNLIAEAQAIEKPN